jgi:hypothetical protein
MAKKADIVSITGASGNHVPINANFEAINTKLDNTLSLDGSVPNTLNADLDLNNNRLLNVSNIITFLWRGYYAEATAYIIGDVVSYNGSTYICTLANVGISPTDTDYWDLFSPKGATGPKGDTGVQGPPGEQGIQGPQGESGTTFLPAPDNIDDTNSTYFYFGWSNISNSWKIRRQNRLTLSLEDAGINNNSLYTNLTSAWANRSSLTYN